MYIIKWCVCNEKYTDIYYLQKDYKFTKNKYGAKKFLTQKLAWKYIKKHNLEYCTVIDYRIELELRNNNPYFIINDVIRIIEECRKFNTGDYGFVANEFVDLIIDELKKEYEEFFINSI